MYIEIYKKKQFLLFLMVEEDGFEPSKRNVTDLQSAPFGLSGTPPYFKYLFFIFVFRLASAVLTRISI